MKIFFDIFLVFLVNKVVSCSVELAEDESVCFFNEKIVFYAPEAPESAELHGKFIIDVRQVSLAKSYDVPLLQECAELNHGLVEFGHDMQKRKRRIQNFIKTLRNSFKETRDRTKLKTTLTHFHCVHALKSIDFEEDNYAVLDLIVNMTKEFPEVMKLHLDVLGYLEDFSFLTVEIVKELFKDKKEYMRPFGLDRFIESASKDVLIEVFKMWNFDLRIEDAQLLLSVRGDDLLEISEEYPRAWLIWRKAHLLKPFPYDLLLEKLSINTFEIYVNLMLAFIFDRELQVYQSMYALEYLYVDLHKNALIEERYMTPEMISALESRKWDIWYQFGKAHINVIESYMKISKRLIAKLKEISKIQEETNAEIPRKLIVINVLTLLQVPLNLRSRTTFLKSRDIDQIIEAQNSYIYYHPFEYTPMVLSVNVLNPYYWQVLWFQLEILEIELAYDAAVCKDYENVPDLMGTIMSLSRFALKNEGAKSVPNYYWHSCLNTLLLSNETRENREISESFIKTMLMYMQDQVCELNPVQLSVFKRYLHEDVQDDIAIFEVRDVSFDAFRMAPESLTQEDIAYLIQTPELKKLMIKYSIENVKRLLSFEDFTADDLKEFFPVGGEYHLDSCEALYTVNPEALREYLFTSQGAVNYPDKLIWWIHPRSWDNSALVDIIAEMIPFSVFFKHPKDADDLNLITIFTDIVGRIKRNPDQSPQKLILKWIIHMEWFFIEFYNHFYIVSSTTKLTCLLYDRILGAERKARANLVTWLKETEGLDDGAILLELVEKSPLSSLRISTAYDLLLSDTVFKLNKGPRPPHFRDVYPQFSALTAAPYVYKIRESELEGTVSQAIRNSERLVEKYFDVIEKQIWLNRLKVASFTTFSKYLLNPIPGKFTDKIFRKQGAPIHDVYVFFHLLARSGNHKNAFNGVHEEDGTVKQCPIRLKVNTEQAERYSGLVMKARRLLLENDLKALKKDDKKK